MENSMFEVYYNEFNSAVDKAKCKGDVDTLQKILEQMEVQEKMSIGIQRKKYMKMINQCKQKLKDKSAEINVNKECNSCDNSYNTNSSGSHKVFQYSHNDNEERAIIDTNEKLILMRHIADDIEQRGKTINKQLDTNNEKFKSIISKTDNVNQNLDGSNTVLTSMVKENSKWNFISRIFG